MTFYLARYGFLDDDEQVDASGVEGVRRADHDSSWENPFGQHRTVRDHYREMVVALRERADAPSRFNLIVRAYDQGVAFRYEIPTQPGLEDYVVTGENTAACAAPSIENGNAVLRLRPLHSPRRGCRGRPLLL